MPVVDNRGNWELWGLLLQILMLFLWIWMVMKSSNECSGVGDFVENIPVKIMILNDQYLGMVAQWEDLFYKAHRAYPSLGDPLKESEILSDMWKFAEACGIPASHVTRRDDVRAAIQKMLDTPGPCLLDVMVPHQEPVFPMMHSGGGFDDILTEADMEWQSFDLSSFSQRNIFWWNTLAYKWKNIVFIF